MTGAPASLKNSLIVHLYSPDVTQMENLDAMGVIEYLGDRDQVKVEWQGGHGYSNIWQSQNSTQNSLNCADL